MFAGFSLIKHSPMYIICCTTKVGSKQGHEHLQQELRVYLSCDSGVAALKTSAELLHGPGASCVLVALPCGTWSLGTSESYVRAKV